MKSGLSTHPTRVRGKAINNFNGNRELRAFRNPHPVMFFISQRVVSISDSRI